MHGPVEEEHDLTAIPAISGHFLTTPRVTRQTPTSDLPLDMQRLSNPRTPMGQQHHDNLAPSDLDEDLIDPDAAMQRVEAAVSRYVQAFQEDKGTEPSASTDSHYFFPNTTPRYSRDYVTHLSGRRSGVSTGEYAPPLPFRT